ncbi:hypothetical protein AKG34_09180 [Peribacillus butanolivorans]|nr:hypothetical protein AKG34_09180 [Peribacillus butanolivorans]
MSIIKTSESLSEEQKKENESFDLFLSTQTVIKEALNKLGYSNELFELLKEPLRMLTVRIPVKMDDGSVKTAQVYKVDMRLAAYMVGIKKSAEASSFRGWV